MKEVGRLLQYDPTGLFCPLGGFHIDPSRKREVVLLSHAHGDHALPGNGMAYTTESTWALLVKRYGDKLKSELRPVQFGRPFELGGVKITFFPAGHILGSAQILLEHDGERYLYTGDFKVQSDPTCEEFHPVKCDYLITETTFADPAYAHPEPESALAPLLEEGVPLVIGAYAVGKAQRITRLLHEMAPHRELHVHPLVAAYHSVYEASGVDLGDWRPYSRKEFLSDSSSILLLPPSVFSRYDRHPGAIRVFATGWKRPYYRHDRLLTISDHADWKDLMKVIEHSEARTIFTLHGDGNLLRDHLSASDRQVVLLS
ncbi:MAG: MBL fold metallo-hydrolase [Bacteroidota bacterium]